MENVNLIEPLALFNLILQPKVLVVDVRNADEYSTGKIPNAIHIPLANLPIAYKKLVESNHVVFYCQKGIRSQLAADFAISKNIINVYSLNGGITAWEDTGYTVVKSTNDK